MWGKPKQEAKGINRSQRHNTEQIEETASLLLPLNKNLAIKTTYSKRNITSQRCEIKLSKRNNVIFELDIKTVRIFKNLVLRS